MRLAATTLFHDERGAGMPEYALILFAVLLLGAAGVKKISPALVNGADTTRRILSGEDVNVNGTSGRGVNGNDNATAGNIDPNGDGNSVGTSGASNGGSSSGVGGGSTNGGGESGGGGSTGIGGSGTGSSNSIAGASAGGGGMLLGASGSSAFPGSGGDVGGGNGLSIGSLTTDVGSGGGSGSGSGGGVFGGGGNPFGGAGSATGNSGSGSGFANSASGSSSGSSYGSIGNAIADFFSGSSSSSTGSNSSSASSGETSNNAEAGKNTAKSLQSVMPQGLLGASRANEVNPPPGQGAVNGPGYTISADGERQMQALLSQARRNVGSKRPMGKCYHQVKIDIQEVGYGRIPRQSANGQLRPLPGSDQGYAHNFADYMNARASNGQTNATNLGLQKLPITNPYLAPPGSIIVVRAGTPGTRNPVAGDIVVAGGNGHFYNDGNMGYRGSQNFPPGNNYVLGIYAPR